MKTSTTSKASIVLSQSNFILKFLVIIFFSATNFKLFAQDTYYQVTVINGTGSGYYPYERAVWIHPDNKSGYEFDSWTGLNGILLFNSENGYSFFYMPNRNLTIEATYKNPTKHHLDVKNGSGSGDYFTGQTVTIKADKAPYGRIFVGWGGHTVDNNTSELTTLQMPFYDTEVYAYFMPITYKITTIVTSDNKPIWNAEVKVGSWSSKTDFKGTATFNSLNMGKVQITVSKSDYLLFESEIDLVCDTTISIELITTSVNDNLAENDLTENGFFCFSPNQTNDIIYLGSLEGDNVQLFSVDGMLMKEVQLNGAKGATADVSDFPPGVYFLRCGLRTEKFIKF